MSDEPIRHSLRQWGAIREMLNQQPRKDFVKPPDKEHGIMGPYLEGSYVIAVLDDVFGAEGWEPAGPFDRLVDRLGDESDPQFIFCRCYGSYRFYGLDADGKERVVTKNDVGVGIAQRGKNPIKPQQWETAIKGADTDLIKRCARQLGAQSGLWLYFDEKEASALFFGRELEEDPRSASPSVETSDDLGPFVYPGKLKELEVVSGLLNEHGKIQAGNLVSAAKSDDSDAVGYLKWLWPKLEASDKKWDKDTGRELKAWLDSHGYGETEPPKVAEKKVEEKKSVGDSLKALLAGAKDETAKVTLPIQNLLAAYLAEAGYANQNGTPNAYHQNNLIRPLLGNEHASIASLTVKQARALYMYAKYVIENGESGKDFAKGILVVAWASNLTWKDACDAFAVNAEDLPSLLKAVSDKMAMSDVEPILHGFGWPTPLPNKEAADFLKKVKELGYKLFDKDSDALAKAMATQWGK